MMDGLRHVENNCDIRYREIYYIFSFNDQVERGLTLAAGAAVVGGLIGLLGYALTSSQREEEAERSKQKK